MVRWFVVIGLLGVVGARPAAAGPACVAADKFHAAWTDAARANETRFEAAVGNLELTAVSLPLAEWKLDASRVGENVVLEREYRGKRARYLMVGEAQCFAGVELARKGDQIVRVERVMQPGKSIKLGLVCGCKPAGDAVPTLARGQMCGGAVRPMMLRGYELPPGTTFGGTVVVRYVADKIDAKFAEPPCPPPP